MKATDDPPPREPTVFNFDFRTLNRETPLEREARLAETFRSRLLRLQARDSPGILPRSARPNALLRQHQQHQQFLRQHLLGQQWAPSLLPLSEIGQLEDAFLPHSILHGLPSRTVGRRQAHCLAPRFCGPISARVVRFPLPSSARMMRYAATPAFSLDGTIEEDADDSSAVDPGVVQQLSLLVPSERLRAVRGMKLALATRREYRAQASAETAWRRGRPDTDLEALQRHTGSLVQALLQGARDGVSLVSRPLAPWHTSLRDVSGRFGTGVSSYFTLIRTLLAFNLLAAALFSAFLVAPQLLGGGGGGERRRGPHGLGGERVAEEGNWTGGNCTGGNGARGANGTATVAFSGLELLTGAGAFTETSFYYGFYSNETLRWGEDAAANATGPPDAGARSYNMQLAYFFTMAAYLLTCVFVLLGWLGRSFSENYRHGGDTGFYSRKVFTGWDFALTSSRAVHVTRRNISTFLKEVLAEGARREQGSPRFRWSRRLLSRAPTWILSVALAGGSAAGLYFLCQSADALERRRGNASWFEASLLLVPAAACLINTLLPPVFTALTRVEGYHSPRHGVYASVGRNMLLKVSLLSVLCYDWLQRSPIPHSQSQCWETRLGQDLYRLVVMDFIFSLLGTFFVEFVWRLLLSRSSASSSSASSCRGKQASKLEQQGSHKPEFDIARNVLDLIYGQTLAWLGIFFAPLLPVVQLVKLVILFYVKRASLYLNCQPPTKPWRAAQMSTIFLLLLFFPSFFSVVAVVAVTMWTREPSPGCGPFRGLPLAYDAVRRWAAALPFGSAAIAWIYHNFVESPLFFFAATSLVLLIIYINVQILAAQRHVIELLQARIEHEGQDKMFVLEKLREEHKRQMEVMAAKHSKRNRRKDKKNYSAQMWPCQADLS